PSPANTGTRVTRYRRAPDTASSGGINFQIINSPGTTVGEIRIRNPFVGKQAASVMIEDGAVNAQKVNAESVAGAVGQFLEIEAGQITAGEAAIDEAVIDKLFAETFAAHKITASELSIASVKPDGTLADGSVSAVTIKDGAITTPKLTVTEDMSAAIVNAMSVNTKKLVVSEEAILNHATLIGQTVV